jgi:serine/threonine protein kinase
MMNHPNVLKFHEALLSERNCYIVTELCNQGSLEDRMRSRQPLNDEELGNIILDLYEGLRYLREKGVTHRDIKPANIFIHNGQCKIADFGLAKFYKYSLTHQDSDFTTGTSDPLSTCHPKASSSTTTVKKQICGR